MDMPVAARLTKEDRFSKGRGHWLDTELIRTARAAIDRDKENGACAHPRRRQVRQLFSLGKMVLAGVHPSSLSAGPAVPPYQEYDLAQNLRCFTVRPSLMSCFRESMPMRRCIATCSVSTALSLSTVFTPSGV